jgi:membrane-bound serine protease (ClpP class)
MKNLKYFYLVGLIFCLLFSRSNITAQATNTDKSGIIAVMRMNMMILPGTSEFLKSTILEATNDGAKVLVIKIDTPGGMLNTSQEIVQEILNAPIPVIVYVSPSGATATSAGVFITLAGHIAAMAPGTSIGAAHPVAGDGKDIEGDMRKKAENMTIAMVKAISDQRGRNTAWAEKAVKESVSATEKEALKEHVVDVVAEDIKDLLKQVAGRKVKVGLNEVTLPDYQELTVREYEISFKDKSINTLANPNVAAILWLAATTGISLELYNPGAILPGVVGVICLILALAVSSIIPITQGGVLLLILGVVLIGSELYVTSGILGIGGVICIVLGSIYLVDVSIAPGLAVNLKLIVPLAVILSLTMLGIVFVVVRSIKRKAVTGLEGMVGLTARAINNFSGTGQVFVNGEVWQAELCTSDSSSKSLVEKNEELLVVRVKQGLTLEVKKK